MKNMQKTSEELQGGVNWREFSTNPHSRQNNIFSFFVRKYSIDFLCILEVKNFSNGLN